MSNVGIYYPLGHQAHQEPDHPERPERVEAIKDRLLADGIWTAIQQTQPVPVPDSVFFAIHTPAHLQRLEAIIAAGGRSDEDTYLTPSSLDIARNSAGGAIALTNAVWVRELATGFALCRPPGHHATPEEAMGFCILNNIALAAQSLIEHGAKRLAILDLDLHHGNGTQDIFYRRNDVAFISIHESPLYPGTGAPEEMGEADGLGLTLNIPLPPFSGDAARDAALKELIFPFLNRYEPEILLVSLGLDAHWRDPLGYQVASTTGYAQILDQLNQWAGEMTDGRLALFLEGGYDLDAVGDIAAAAFNILLGNQWEDRLGPGERPESPRWEVALKRVKNLWRF
ncbi:MAG: histone deacetylase [Chloroflexi bacterium]|nr:histone deacetylase [Chloroflexota bacterium]